ncbi:Psi-producing oxygenase [Drechslerella dactyloides]|uniref:Psi-producing oxygenase n=1 Tax=Drechslerella dactyloides TaxID=74499 RepID=A0AAD6IVV4_DREDA|nr:Psi-producing oxygenase [Drechslerella dactyloides]
MVFPWSRSNSVKSPVSGASPNEIKAKRRSSSFLKFNEKAKVKTTNGVSSAIGTNGDAEEDEIKPSMLQRAASSMLPDHMARRPEIEVMLSEFANVLKASLRPLPTSNDGRYEKEPEPSSGFFKDLRTFNITDIRTLREVLQPRVTGDLIDDRTYITERIIQLVADLPTSSRNRVTVTNDFIDRLWNCHRHPQPTYLGEKYTYRQADGSYNNIQSPHIGQAGQPLTRSVRPTIQPQGAFPDSGLVFDAVMSRAEYKRNPNNVSSLLFYFGQIISHDVFKTDTSDENISRTSSYLDLAPLYGSNENEVAQMRTFEGGKIKLDCFSDKRLLGFPPGVGVILIMFNRWHNYVAETLAAIDEHSRFSIPAGMERDKTATQKQDEDLFQTARLVTSSLYINIVLTDYLRTILNLNRTSSTWNLDPRVGMDKAFGVTGTSHGIGNQASFEFGFVHRWSSCISRRDERWFEEFYQRVLPGQDLSQTDTTTATTRFSKWEASIDADPAARDFYDVRRDSEGMLPDDELVSILAESIEDCAGSFGARSVPVILKIIECLGIEQARRWRCASLNEFRQYLGLKPHTNFEDINPDPRVSEALRRLYDHPDFVELYPGLVSEEAKTPMVPGVGASQAFTASRAYLSDIISLVRGDRFYTVDYTPANLTNWGFSEIAGDPAINQGCVFHKLFLKAFPHHFRYNSIYAFYPLTIPTENHKIMTDLGRVADFDYARPGRMPSRINISSYKALKTVLSRIEFKVTWGANFDYMMSGNTWMLSGDTDMNADQRVDMHHAIYGPSNWQRQVFEFYEQKTTELLKKHTYSISGKQMVDAVRDVINIVHTHFAANLFCLPLKTEDNPRGVYTEQELYTILSVMFTFVFFDIEPTKSFALHKAGRMVAGQLAHLIEANVIAINKTSFMKNIIDNIYDQNSSLKDYGIHLIRRLLESGKTAQEITWQMFSQILDFYLEPQNAQHLADIQKQALDGSPSALDKLRRYVLEGSRLSGTLGLYRKADRALDLTDGDNNYNLKRGDVVFVNFITASRDPAVFPDPLEVKLDRPEDTYIHHGYGRHKCLGRDVDLIALTAMLKVFGKLRNLRRAPGIQGTLKYVPRPGGSKVYLKEDWSSLWPFPTTMRIMFDEGIE